MRLPENGSFPLFTGKNEYGAIFRTGINVVELRPCRIIQYFLDLVAGGIAVENLWTFEP